MVSSADDLQRRIHHRSNDEIVPEKTESRDEGNKRKTVKIKMKGRNGQKDQEEAVNGDKEMEECRGKKRWRRGKDKRREREREREGSGNAECRKQ